MFNMKHTFIGSTNKTNDTGTYPVFLLLVGLLFGFFIGVSIKS